MNRGLSLHLDALRALAALCVLFHHYSDDVLRGGWFPHIGQEAVMVFFGLSGFIIAWVVAERETAFSEYLVRRFSRLWSVLLPAVGLLLVAIALSSLLPLSSFPRADQLEGYRWTTLVKQSVLSVTFGNWNFHYPGGYYLPWGRVMWSLTCEFWYYILFGIAVFLPRGGGKLFLLAIIGLVLGPGPLLLLPVWLSGCLACYIVRAKPVASVGMGFFLMAMCAGVFAAMHILNFRERLTLPYFGIPLSYAQPAPYYWILGILFAGYLIGAAMVSSARFQVPEAMRRVIIRVAGVSFFLYLTHYPIMQIAVGVFGGKEPFPCFAPLVALIFALLVGRPVEDSKRWVANMLRPFFLLPGLKQLSRYNLVTSGK